MMNGTPFTGAMSCHIENIREQNGPGAAYVHASVSDSRSVRIGERVLLGDHPAHRHAHQVEAGDAEVVDQRLRVVGEQATSCRARAARTLAPTPRLSNRSTR